MYETSLYLVQHVTGLYEKYYLQIAVDKTKIFGVAGVQEGSAGEVLGKHVKFQLDNMKHLGVVLPLRGPVVLTQKTQGKLESVLELWGQEQEIPIDVAKGQFQAEVLGALRHQQQAARIPAKLAAEWQQIFEVEIRKKLHMGAAPPADYLRAERPYGLGLGDIDMEGAVDFIAGLGQHRWANACRRKETLREISEQLKLAGTCNRVTIPQHGPWQEGEQTVLQDMMRSIEQLGVGIVWEDRGKCTEVGPQIVRASYRARNKLIVEGTELEYEFSEGVELRKWPLGRGNVYTVSAPHEVVQQLAGGRDTSRESASTGGDDTT